MQLTPIANRFALAGSDGRIVALVADGPDLPEWPADITDASVEDAALLTMEQAYSAEFDRLATEDELDEDRMRELAGYVRQVRDEAERRIQLAEGDQGDDEPVADPTAPPAAPAPAPDAPPAPDDAQARADRIAALRSSMAPAPAPLPEPGVSREDLVAAVSAASAAAIAPAVAAMTQAVQTLQLPAPAAVPAGVSARTTARDLAPFRPAALAPTPAAAVTPLYDARLVSTGDNPNMSIGSEFEDLPQLVEAFSTRLDALGQSAGVSDEKVPIATLRMAVPEERDLRDMDWTMARTKVKALTEDRIHRQVTPEEVARSLVASGGLDAPVTPYYGQLVVATAAEPVRDAMTSFVADRGGIKLLLPPSIGSITGINTVGAFTDGVTNTDTSFTSASAAFTAADIGSYIVGAGIVNGTRIVAVGSGTAVTLSAATTATATGVAFRITGRNPNNLGAPVGLQSAAQDLVGGPTNVKYTYDVPNGTAAEFDVYSVYTSLQFANLTARTSPERVEAYIKIVDALAARVAETQRLDVMTAWSTLLTGAKTFGTARQLLAQWGHMGAFYRNSERMEEDAALTIGVPAWSIQAMRADYLATFIGGGAANWGLSDDEIISFFVEHNLNPFFYLDGPSDVSQLFATTALAAATNTGANTATPTPIPDFPGSGATTSFRTKVVSFMYAEGTWLDLTTGELNLGLVRDSVLNAQNRFRNFQEKWETPAFVGTRSLRCVHTVAADGTYGAAASITLGVGSGL